jgi:hypothetical protein
MLSNGIVGVAYIESTKRQSESVTNFLGPIAMALNHVPPSVLARPSQYPFRSGHPTTYVLKPLPSLRC